MGKPKILHFRESCIACNACVLNDNKNWEIDIVDGKANLINAKKRGAVYVLEIGEEEVEDNKQAELGCPMKIIRVVGGDEQERSEERQN